MWARLRLALEAGNTGVARRVAEYLPADEQPDGNTLARIAVNPQAYLERKSFNLKSRAGRETLMFAVQRLARTSPQLAAQQWTQARRAAERSRTRLRVGHDRLSGRAAARSRRARLVCEGRQH